MPKLSIPEIKALLEDAKAAYKAKFTPGFYHGSPSNKIKEFDASKGDRAFPTEGVTFLTKEPEFSHSFIDVHKNKTSGGWDYNKGSTIYPVSANLGKHFDPDTPEGSETIKQYLQNKYSKEAGTDYFDDAINQKHEHMMDRLTDPVNNWKLLESPGLLDHLKNTGHNSFAVTEGGIKNVGVFNPADIRGKFADYNPDEAMNPDFMKADGGSVEGYATGGLSNLPEGGDLLHQQAKSEMPDVSMDVRTMPNMNGMPGVGYMQMPQSAMARMQLEKELENQTRLRAGVSAMGMAIPGQSGVRVMPGQMDVGANIPVGPGHLDLSAMRSINPMPGGGHMQGVRANYSIPFAAGGSVEGYAGGGKIEALKQLAHAVAVPFTHFSKAEGLNTLEPLRYGTGMKGAEAARLSTATDIAPRSYFYHGDSIVPESGVGGNKYTGVSQNSYPWSKDPAGFYDQARTNDPYLMEMGIRQHSPEHTINNMERMIKNAGYSGYHTDTGTGVLFNDTPVIKAQ